MALKERIQQFIEIPEVAAWHKAADLKPRTRGNYSLRLMQIFDTIKLTPTQFLEECNTHRKEVLGRIKTALGEVRTRSASIAHEQRAALN